MASKVRGENARYATTWPVKKVDT